MKKTLTTSEAADLLKADTNAGWSYAGARALVEYLEEQETEGEPMEFDRVALRCEYSEHESATAAAADNGWEPEADDDDEAREAAALEWLRDRCTVIEFEGGVIVSAF
jgi:hypothetical protein